MRRSMLTGIFVCILSASVIGIAAADESPSGPSALVSGSTGPSARVSAISGANANSDYSALLTRRAEPATRIAAPAAGARASGFEKRSRLRRFASGIVTRSSAIASSLTRSAMRFIGTPYVFGGTHSTGFDCSGYVQHVFALLGVQLPRTADAQYDAGRGVVASMQPGDLVFFHTYAAGISHVGIYLGKSRFIHSSSSRGVAISSLHDRYWAPRYLGVKRVFGT